MANGIENLIPNEDRTPEERRESARVAGIKSGEARRNKKLMSDIFAEFLEEEYSIKIKGVETKVTGAQHVAMVTKAVLSRRSAASVSLMKLITESTEGKKIKAELVGAGGGPILTHGLNSQEAEEFKKRFAEMHPELNPPKEPTGND